MKVAIIGAGIAGLSAAQALKRCGVAQITVFEKSRGLGGRISTKRFDWGEIDIGAQYFTVRDAIFKRQVDDWLQQRVVAQWRFSPHVVEGGKLISKPDQTVRYVATPSMNRLAFSLGVGLQILLSTRVTAVKATGDGWRIESDSGHHCDEVFDWVIVALPAEQAASLMDNHAISTNIPSAVHIPCWALALATRGKVAPDIQGIFGDEWVSWVSRLTSRPQREVAGQYDDLWMLHFSSEYSKQHVDIDAEQLLDHGITWLSQTLGLAAKPLQVAHHYQHYWRYARVADPAQQPGLLVDHAKRLAVIGDWCYGGRIEAAYLAGTQLVDQVFNEYPMARG